MNTIQPRLPLLKPASLPRPAAPSPQAPPEPRETYYHATPIQKAVAGAGMAASAATVAGLVATGGFSSLASTLAIGASAVAAFFVTDVGSGLVHHFLDNVNPDKLARPLASIAHDFQNHHENQRDVVHRDFAHHTAETQVVTTPVLMGLAAMAWTVPHLAAVTTGLLVAANCATLAQEFHKRAHMSDKENPRIVKLAQKLGIMVPRRLHAQHHASGHKSHYALLNGASNRVLDDFKFRLTPGGPKTNILRKMEVLLYKWQGSEPNAWAETAGLREEALGKK
jgi:ubiquitin-conjugating enzyme E2 variant